MRGKSRPPVLTPLSLQAVSAAVEKVLGRTVGADAVLMAAGLDSLGSEELVAELSKIGRIDLPGATAALQLFLRCLTHSG